LQAHRQGNIDQLCGIYAVLNSTRLVTHPGRCKPHLLKKCISALSRKKGSTDFIGDGTDITDIAFLLKEIICKEHPKIKRRKPWHKRSSVDLDEYWSGCTDYLKSPNRAIIILFHTDYMGHWTVVKAATDKKFSLFDSIGTRDLKRDICTTSELTESRTKQLFPTMTYFLET